jgi:hypothetical protein
MGETLTVAECDGFIEVLRKKLNDPRTVPAVTWLEIDRFLDLRIEAMKSDAIQGRKRSKKVLGV